MQFLSGLDGLGRYFETEKAYEEGERFEIEGADGDYEAPVAGVGRYFEDAIGERLGSKFEIAGANMDYKAPEVGGVGRYMLDDTADFGVGRYMLDDTANFGMGDMVAADPQSLEAEGLLGLGAADAAATCPNKALTIGIGVGIGLVAGYVLRGLVK